MTLRDCSALADVLTTYAVMALKSWVPAMPASKMRDGLSLIPFVITMMSAKAAHEPTNAPLLTPITLPPMPRSITQTAPSDAPAEIPSR